MQHAEGGHGGADVDDRHGQLVMAIAHLGREQGVGALQCVGFDIDHLGIEPGQCQRGFAHFDVFLATGGQQHVDPFRIACRGALHFEIDGHFFQRVGDVLVGLDLQLVLQVVVGEPGFHFDGLGDHGRTGHGYRSDLDAGTCLGDHSGKGLPHALQLSNVLLDHCVWRERLDGIGLHFEAASRATQFKELD
ncbi:hypothetical protein D3C85_813390 [compost metagenome]